MPIEMPPGQRKYTTEFTLIVSVAGAYLLRAQDLTKIPVESFADGPPCNLYVISRTPRISIDPASVRFENGEVVGTATVHNRGQTEPHEFRTPHDLGPDDLLTWTGTWPFEDYAIVTTGGKRVSGGVCALLGAMIEDWPAAGNRHEVLYVGQAFGEKGERTAWDRLKKHETLQRILGDQLPDTQVWLTMATIFDVAVMQEMLPEPGRIDGTEDLDHVMRVLKKTYDEGFQGREAVALAEAGLIRGWQPEYNDRLKYNFPARKQVSLDTARDLDLHGLVVEWQSIELPSKYYSGSGNPASLAFFGYKVHTDPDRAQTLVLSGLDGGESLPGLPSNVLARLPNQLQEPPATGSDDL